MKKLVFLVILFVMGCATLDTTSLDWIPIGPDFPPTDPEKIEVLSSSKDVERAYGNLGLLRVRNLKPDREDLRLGVEKGRQFVASKGADAILLGQYNSGSDGASDPRVTLIIYAIKYMDTLTEADKKALKDFEVMGILNERVSD